MNKINGANKRIIIISLVVFLLVLGTLFFALFKYSNLQALDFQTEYKSKKLESDASENIRTKSLSEQDDINQGSSNQESGNQGGSNIKNTLDDNNDKLLETLNVDQEVVTFAIFGTDERSTEISRSDIIMVIKYYPNIDELTLVSVPRDTRVYIPGYYDDKINHAFAFGGPELSQLTLENLFEIKIDYYFKFSFEDFKTIVDTLGGVKVNAKKNYVYNGNTTIYQGENILNGTNALFYVRFRSDSEVDFGRIKRQQEVIESLAHTVKAYNEDEIVPLLLQLYENNMITNITLDQMIDFLELRGKEVPSFSVHTLKTNSTTINGIWYEIIQEEDLASLKELLKK